MLDFQSLKKDYAKSKSLNACNNESLLGPNEMPAPGLGILHVFSQLTLFS